MTIFGLIIKLKRQFCNIKTYNNIGDNMDNLASFKSFVRKNPVLVKYVRNDQMTWQKFYELYDLYGEENSVWEKYLNSTVKESTNIDFISWLKSIDLDSFQESVNSVRRVIGVLQDLGTKDTNNTNSNYEPRPLYKHFED